MSGEEENGFRTGAHPTPVIQGARGRWRWGEGRGMALPCFRKAPLTIGIQFNKDQRQPLRNCGGMRRPGGAREGTIRAITRARQRGPIHKERGGFPKGHGGGDGAETEEVGGGIRGRREEARAIFLR